MSKIVWPKHSADLFENKAALQVYYENKNNGWISNETYKIRLKELIGAGQDESAYTKKIQLSSYYGFIIWEDISNSRSPKKITQSGIKFYEDWDANNQDAMFEDIVLALKTCVFGRNNCGSPECDSDIEPPPLVVRAILDLEHITRAEMVYLLWSIDNHNSNYTDVIRAIKKSRDGSELASASDASNYYKDNKPITILLNWGFLLETPDKHIVINPKVKTKYEHELRELAIFNVDKVSSMDNYKENTNPVSQEIEIIEKISDDITIKDLGKILGSMYENASSKTTAIHVFGLKYGEVIKKNDYSLNEILDISGLQESYVTEINKGIRLFNAISDNEFGIRFYREKDKKFLKGDLTMLPTLPKRIRNRFSLNRIMYGAPGTGKTYSSMKYALAVIEDKAIDDYKDEKRENIMARYNAYVANKQIVFTTFHQNYGYEDFIQGLRPDISRAPMAFNYVDGVFKTIADNAMKSPEKDFVIIIDEINRANISKVFGELITLIEDDKRWGEENALAAQLPSGEIFAVPNNLYILGTMNSADKSISLIDTALRRRFEFVEFAPEVSAIADPILKKVFQNLNEGLEKDLESSDLLIGHSFFIGKVASDLDIIFNSSIIPLLYEYYYDNTQKVENLIKKSIEGIDELNNLTIDKTSFGRIKLIKKDSHNA